MTNNVLEVSGLVKYYGSLKAVDSLSFAVKRGAVFGFLGPNGSGKSTTLGMITHVVNPTAGAFSWFGQPHTVNQGKKLGTLLERPNFYGYMNAVDNLKIVAEIRDIDQPNIDEVLMKIGLYERRKSRFKSFSFGMQQRLAIGSAMLGNPDVLILDEPTNGLDPQGIAEIRQMIISLSREGKTVILASHLLDEVQKVCTDVIILRKGVKIYSGNIHALSIGSNVLELKAPNMIQLYEVASTHPKINNLKREDDMLLATIDDGLDPSEINAYLLEYGVCLSHLNKRQASLESQFLDLLKTGEV